MGSSPDLACISLYYAVLPPHFSQRTLSVVQLWKSLRARGAAIAGARSSLQSVQKGYSYHEDHVVLCLRYVKLPVLPPGRSLEGAEQGVWEGMGG